MGWQGQQHQHNQNINYNGPAGGMGEQRPRGLSDDDQRPGPPLGAQGGMLAPQQHAQQHSKATVGRPPQQAGIIGGGVRTGAVGMGSLGWSGAGDDDLDQMQNGLLGLGLGGCDKMGGGASGQQSFVSGLPHEDQSAVEVERARQQVSRPISSCYIAAALLVQYSFCDSLSLVSRRWNNS